MDALRADDIERARRAAPGERLLQALDATETGLTLQRQKLRRRFPEATEDELAALLRRWLLGEDV